MKIGQVDTWIDTHCLDADVFVLVANSESTFMQTVCTALLPLPNSNSNSNSNSSILHQLYI